MSLEDRIIKAYEKRDNYAQQEMNLEDKIFDPEATHTDEERRKLTRSYQAIKDQRSHWSVVSADLFMEAGPEERRAVTDKWTETSEGKRKAEDTGIRGGTTDEDLASGSEPDKGESD